MSGWENKTFRVLKPVREAFEALMDRKGEQMYAVNAAMIWYISTSKEDRLDYESAVRRIEQGVSKIEQEPGPTAGYLELKAQIEQIDEKLALLTQKVALGDAPSDSATELGRDLDEASKRVEQKQAATRRGKKSG